MTNSSMLLNLWMVLSKIGNYEQEWSKNIEELIQFPNQERDQNTVDFIMKFYQFIQKNVVQKYQSAEFDFKKFDIHFIKALEKQLDEFSNFGIDQDNLQNFLYQASLIELKRLHLFELTDKLTEMSRKYYCLKNEKLNTLLLKSDSNQFFKEQNEKQIENLAKDQIQNGLQLQKMQEYTNYFESEEVKRLQYGFLSLEANKIPQDSHPILPHIFINFNMAKFLQNMNKNIDHKKLAPYDVMKEPKFMLDNLQEIQNIESISRDAFSLVSNSDLITNQIIQKIFDSKRIISTSGINIGLSDENESYQGDLVSFLNIMGDKKYAILTIPGLNRYSDDKNDFNLKELNLNIKNFNKQNHEDNKYYSQDIKECNIADEEINQLRFILHLIKKTLTCQFLIMQSRNIFVIIQDNEEDYLLYQRIKLLCSDFIQDKKIIKRNIYFIHYHPDIIVIKNKIFEQQFKKIKAKYDIFDEDFDYVNLTIFKQKDDSHKQRYRNQIDQEQFKFQHFMLFGNINNNNNKKIFGKIKDLIKNSKSKECIIPNKISERLTDFMKEKLNEYFCDIDNKLQFKEAQFKHGLTDEKENRGYLRKDLLLYPFNFLKPEKELKNEEGDIYF